MTQTTTAPPARRDGAPPGDGPPRRGVLRSWAADLWMGARFAVGGGREGWARTALTALGVGIGVTVLLIAASVPQMLGAREARTDARENYGFSETVEKSDRSALYFQADTHYRGESIRGRIFQPDGDHPPVPPGVEELPDPGTMLVSPALRDVLESPEGALLRERLAYDIVGTIADEGLSGPSELSYYAGRDDLEALDDAYRIDRFDPPGPDEPLRPALLLLMIVICVVLLLPVGAFIGAAVRFGSEGRDRRLAALRLVGTDSRGTRRIAAGEAATGALLGLLTGAVGFAALRPALGGLELQELSVFTADVVPDPVLAVTIALLVPTCAVMVTLLALRGVVIEPLGVVRKTEPRRRRLWWRVLPPGGGVALLTPLMLGRMSERSSDAEIAMIAAGIVLVLVGVTTLLPWLVEAVVRRLRGGGLSFQLAVRRLQLDSGTAARAVSGITVAVAGSIALTGLFGAVTDQDRQRTGQDPTRAEAAISFDVADDEAVHDLAADLREAPGVTEVWGYTAASAMKPGSDPREYVNVTIADCATLRRLAHLTSCAEGDVFYAPAGAESYTRGARPGEKLDLATPVYERGEGEVAQPPALWTVPEDAGAVRARTDPAGRYVDGVLATPSAFDLERATSKHARVFVRTDPADADALEHVRNTATAVHLGAYIHELASESTSDQLRMITRGLYIGAAGTLVLIGASMVVAVLEQLRERRRLLSVLVAFGTRRSTLAWSVLWQTAVPVLLGLGLAALTGVGLGAVLLRMADLPVGVDWTALASLTGLGGALIVLVTVLSLPALWRLMRPDGLRTE